MTKDTCLKALRAGSGTLRCSTHIADPGAPVWRSMDPGCVGEVHIAIRANLAIDRAYIQSQEKALWTCTCISHLTLIVGDISTGKTNWHYSRVHLQPTIPPFGGEMLRLFLHTPFFRNKTGFWEISATGTRNRFWINTILIITTFISPERMTLFLLRMSFWDFLYPFLKGISAKKRTFCVKNRGFCACVHVLTLINHPIALIIAWISVCCHLLQDAQT